MSTDFKITIPDFVKKVILRLEAMGFEGFVVGGCVRDFCLNKVPLDWDVCTNATPDLMLKIFSDDFTVIPTGIKHGTVTVISDGNKIEVTTYRSDGDYSDNRHPEYIKFLPTINEDLSRRDFTANAIAYNDKVGFIDLFNGIDDIKNGILRTVGDASLRFSEDALRILRGLRFSAVCSFNIEDKTKNAILTSKNLLKSISAERIYVELTKLLLAQHPSKILIEYRDVFEVIIPEAFNTQSFNPDICKLIDKMPPNISVRFAVMLLCANNHCEILKRLRFDKLKQKHICTLISNADMQLPTDRISVKKALNKFGPELLNDIIDIYGIKSNNFDEMKSERENTKNIINQVINSAECYSLDMLAINGSELIKAGFEAGPYIGKALNSLLTDVIEEKIENNSKILINCAKKFLT